MFYLGGSSFPATREQLIEAVTAGLRELFTLPSDRQVIRTEGEFPGFDKIIVDLTGARADTDRLPPEPKGTGQIQPGVATDSFEVVGHPLYVRGAAAQLSLTARHVLFGYDRNEQGRPLLVLTQANDGHVAVEIKNQDAEALVLAGAQEAAAQQGVKILEARLHLQQLDERTVAVEVRTKAKKLFVTAVVVLRGKLRVDDALNATLTDLACTGEGMLGEMASKVITPKLAAINGRTVSLAALSLGDVRLRDLRVQTGDALRITAAFGS